MSPLRPFLLGSGPVRVRSFLHYRDILLGPTCAPLQP